MGERVKEMKGDVWEGVESTGLLAVFMHTAFPPT